MHDKRIFGRMKASKKKATNYNRNKKEKCNTENRSKKEQIYLYLIQYKSVYDRVRK